MFNSIYLLGLSLMKSMSSNSTAATFKGAADFRVVWLPVNTDESQVPPYCRPSGPQCNDAHFFRNKLESTSLNISVKEV